MTDKVEAGAAVVDITPGAGIAMGGYGARQGVAEGIHDDLHARTLVLTSGDAPIVLAVCDLVAVTTDIVDEARALIEAEHGIPAGRVSIAATHTHSGPGTLRRKDAADFVTMTARKIAGSVPMALRALLPVTLKAAAIDVGTIGQNRRDPAGPLETRGTVLFGDPGHGAPPVFTLINHATHATVLEHDNLLYTADFPGAAARLVERSLGGVCIYVQGTCGDVNPVWMRHDFADADRVGGILGAAAVRAVNESRPLGEGQWGINLSWSEEIEQRGGGTVLDDVRLDAASVSVKLPRKPVPDVLEVDSEIAHLRESLDKDPSRARELRPRLNELNMVRIRAAMAGENPRTREEVEIQVLRIARQSALIALPGEFFVETGRTLRDEAGVEHLVVAGYANGYVGYVPPAHEHGKGGYEVGISRFAPPAEEIVVREALALLKRIM